MIGSCASLPGQASQQVTGLARQSRAGEHVHESADLVLGTKTGAADARQDRRGAARVRIPAHQPRTHQQEGLSCREAP